MRSVLTGRLITRIGNRVPSGKDVGAGNRGGSIRGHRASANRRCRWPRGGRDGTCRRGKAATGKGDEGKDKKPIYLIYWHRDWPADRDHGQEKPCASHERSGNTGGAGERFDIREREGGC